MQRAGEQLAIVLFYLPLLRSDRDEVSHDGDEHEETERTQPRVQWSGVEWNGVEWSGAEWSGVECLLGLGR